MDAAYFAITVWLAAMVLWSAIAKLRRDPKVTKVVHEMVGVPFRYFPLLAACELAGTLGLVLGIQWPPIGIGAGVGLVVYFLGAVVSHLRVGDFRGVGPAVLMLVVGVAALILRVLT